MRLDAQARQPVQRSPEQVMSGDARPPRCDRHPVSSDAGQHWKVVPDTLTIVHWPYLRTPHVGGADQEPVGVRPVVIYRNMTPGRS
jgi:hypothetical protein